MIKNNYKKIAVIGALDYEVEIIIKELSNIKKHVNAATTIYEGDIASYKVAVMKCGMGKVSAAVGTQMLIDIFKPECVINLGCAGALHPELKIGDVVISENVIEWDLDLRQIGYELGYIDALKTVKIPADCFLSDSIMSIVSDDKSVNVKKGTIVSGDQFISTDLQRKYILTNFPDALCAEMEGAAVGHTCKQNNIPFCILRTMSDTADGNSNIDFAKFSVLAGKKSAEWFLKLISD